jgi:hypothetical protein
MFHTNYNHSNGSFPKESHAIIPKNNETITQRSNWKRLSKLKEGKKSFS